MSKMWTSLCKSQTFPGKDGEVLPRDLFLEGNIRGSFISYKMGKEVREALPLSSIKG
jgi:hypothetical protein